MTFKKVTPLALAAVLSAAGLSAYAQSTTQGAISGTVFDATDAAVPNAKIVIHNDGTNAELTLTSDGSGFFKAPQLAPGTYTVTISAPGFNEIRNNQVIVAVNQVTEVNPHLATGAETTTVEVTADAPVLKFDTPAYGGQLSNAEIENIPINNRRWSSLALLTPGVSNDASGFGLIAFRAISPILNNVEIDGADDNQAFFGEERGRTRAGYSTSQIAIREFQVNTGVYSSEFGRAVGGVINSVTKSGTNSLHGELYFYHRDSQWGAYNNYTLSTAYNPATGITTQGHLKPKDKRNQFGFGVGGPLIKDRLFFFYAFDQYRRTFPGVAKANSTTVFADPNDAQLALLVSRGIAANSTAALATYRSYMAALVGDLGNVPRYGFQTINTPKLDYQINGKNHVSGLYHRLRWDSPGGVQTQQSNAYSRDGYGTDFVKLDYGLAKLDTIVSNNITNELRYQYGRELNDEGRQANTPLTNQYLIPSSGIPVQVSPPSTAFQIGQQYYSFRTALPDERKWQLGDTAIWQLGNHSVKFGVDILHNYDLQNTLGSSIAPPNGNFNYGTAPVFPSTPGATTGPGTTAASGPANAFLNLVSDLVRPSGSCEAQPSGSAPTGVGTFGCFSSYTQTIGPTTFDLATLDQGYFLQDDWKVRPNLTLNLGVRYDYQTLPPAYGNLANAAIPGINNLPSDKNNISPRVGFAWDPYGAGKTVVRGGFGMYYGHLPNGLILGVRNTTGSVNGQLPVTVYNNSSLGVKLPQTPNPALLAGSPSSPALLASNLQNPYTEQFDLAVQQELGMNTVLSVSYLGSLGRELPNFLNLNLNPAATYTVNYTVTGTGNCGPIACGTVFPVKVYSRQAYTGTGTATANNTLIPAYNAITTVVSNVNASYHALTVEVQKRASKFISYDANYTWSHAQDYNQNQSTGPNTNSWFDPYGNTRANYANSYLDIRHRAVGWMIFNIPGVASHGLLSYAVNGWSIKPAVQIQSGLPYTATVSGSAPNSCTSAQVAANASGCLVSAGSGLSGTGVAYIPYLGRNTYQLPRDILIDLRLQKDFKASDRFSVQFIGESFNLVNHQNVTGINNGAYSISNGSTNGTGNLGYVSSFGTVTNTNNNFAYGPRTLQAGARVFF